MNNFQKIIQSFRRKIFISDCENFCKLILEKKISRCENFQNKEYSPSFSIAFEATEDLYYYIIFSILVTNFSKRFRISAYQFSTHCFSPGESKNLIIFSIKKIITRLGNIKWKKLYSSFGITSNSDPISLKKYLNISREAFLFWKELKDKNTLLRFTHCNVWIGDLVIDTYLRFKPAPTVRLRDPFLLLVLWRAMKEVHRSKAFFEKVRPLTYLTPYTTYVHHGVPTRVAIECGINVYAFGNYQEFAKLITSSDLVHTRNCDKYKEDFAKFIDADYKRNQAEVVLKKRFSGITDPSLSYMRESAYSHKGSVLPEIENRFVIFLHDFYDSPHVYKDMIFNDFWDWICYTIEQLESLNAKYVIKPHPNQIELSDEVIIRLKTLYPSAVFLSEHVNNIDLVKAGMRCAITVYGTIAHEMAYLGIPTISCAHHPHTSFEFVLNASTLDQYSYLLTKMNIQGVSILWNASVMREQSLEFVYMHYMNLDYDENQLLENLACLRMEINLAKIDKHRLNSLLDRISDSTRVKDFVNNLPQR
jgi:hypothetical protein